jgi:hypothetical protein
MEKIIDRKREWSPEEWAVFDKETEEMFAEQDYFKRIEEDYYENEWPKVMKSIGEWMQEFPPYEIREMRRRYLLERIQEEKDEKKLQSLVWEAKVYLGEVKGVTPEMIERARRYPLDKLIKSRGGMAKCPFHKDDSPSLNIRNNFYYCHAGCGSGDVIDFVMKTKNVSFKQAVEMLL